MSRPTINIQDSVAYRVHRAARVLRKHFLQIADRWGFDVTPEQWFVLNKLAWNDGQSQNDLCDTIFADRPNLSRMLAKMEAKGLVERRADPADGRRVLVFLTPLGRTLHNGFAAGVGDERERLFVGLNPDDVAALVRVLDQLERNLSR